MKKIFLRMIPLVLLTLLWLVAWGDFAEWRYSKNMHCEKMQNSREGEICKSIEKYQEYEFVGHAMISAGYRSSFATAKKAWCELSLTESDLMLLKEMQFDHRLPPQLVSGSEMLFSLLDAKLHPNPDLYPVSGVYSPQSPGYLLKAPCG